MYFYNGMCITKCAPFFVSNYASSSEMINDKNQNDFYVHVLPTRCCTQCTYCIVCSAYNTAFSLSLSFWMQINAKSLTFYSLLFLLLYLHNTLLKTWHKWVLGSRGETTIHRKMNAFSHRKTYLQIASQKDENTLKHYAQRTYARRSLVSRVDETKHPIQCLVRWNFVPSTKHQPSVPTTEAEAIRKKP